MSTNVGVVYSSGEAASNGLPDAAQENLTSSGTSGSGQTSSTSTSPKSSSVSSVINTNPTARPGGGDGTLFTDLQFPSRVMGLTVAQCAVGVIQAAKGNAVAGAAVAAVETLLALVAIPAAFVCGPAAAVCEAPVRGADWMLCKGLDATEALLPCIFMPPAQVCGAVQSCAGACICCVPRTVGGVASRICAGASRMKLN